MERLRQQAEMMFLSVRNLDDFDDLEQTLIDLLSPLDAILANQLGFSGQAAARFARTMGEFLNRNLATRKSQGEQLLDRLEAAIAGHHEDIPDDLKPYLNEAKDQQGRRDLLVAYTTQHTFASFSDVYSVQVAEVAQSLSISEDAAKRLLGAFSITFGDVESSFSLPVSMHDFLFRPIVKSEREYFCPIPDLLLWSIRPRLEELVKDNANLWDVYQKHRANFLVEQGATSFGKMLGSPTVLKSLKYESDQFSSDHTFHQYELDLAVLFNGIVFLVECKGGTLPVKARGGKSRASQDAVEDLILDPSSQLDRARRYIEGSSTAQFELPSGLIVSIDRNSIDRLFTVALTLEDVNLFVADPKSVPVIEDQPDGTVPWIVNLLTLQSIVRFIQFPAEFVHYLSRRLRLNVIKKIHAVEELDYFGDYLSTGLYFDEAEIGPYTNVALDGCTDRIEAYRRFEKGRSEVPVEKPQQKFPPLFARMLTDLQTINSPVRLQVSLSLLEMGGKARFDISTAITDCRHKTAKDGKLHDFSTVRKDGEDGFTFVCAEHLSPAHLFEHLTAFCNWKLEKHLQSIGRELEV